MKKIKLANKKLEEFLKSKRAFSKYINAATDPKNDGVEIYMLETDEEYNIANSFLWTFDSIDFWSKLHLEFINLYKEKDISMNIYAIDGHKVVVNTFDAGYDYQKEDIKRHFKIGDILTVEHTDVCDSNTDVYFHEVPNIAFNSVFFSDVKKQIKKNDKKNPYYKIYNK